ncbi:MAG: peptidoglycan-binding domain-containing protein [Patescibacteria group bacterium]
MKKIFKIAIVALAIVATGAATANAAFDANLSVGATGADVSALQSWLISKGFAIPSISSGAAQPGYFGQQTKAAVVAYQASVGLPSTGFVGPLTRGILNGAPVVGTTPSTACPVGYTCTANPGTTPTTPSTGSLAGTDGNIQTVDLLSQYSDEEVGEGESDVKVFGFEVEASNDGDIALKSVKVEVVPDGTNSDHLDDYIDGVTIWQGTTKIGSANVDDFSQASNDTWSKTVTVSNSVVRADETEKFYITVDAVNSFDSADINDDAHTIDVTSIRFEDGSGVVTTEAVAITAQQMDFVSFSTSADTELKISKDSSTSPTEVVVIDETDNTDDVTLLVGKFQVKGTSDVLIDEIPVTLTTVGGSTVAAVTGSINLKIDGEEFSETVSTAATTGTTTFNNLDLTLSAGKTYTFTVTADINNVDTGTLDEGDTIQAEVTATNVDYIDAENEEGDQLADNTEKTGTALGDALALYSEGINVVLKSVSAAVDADGTNTYNDTGTFTITYSVSSFGDTVYLSDTGTATTSETIPDATLASGGNRFLLDIGGTASTSALSTGVSFSKSGGADDSANGNIELADGESTDITLTVSRTNTAVYANGGLMKVLLKAILWNSDDSASTFQVYDFDLEDYDTSNTSEGGKLISVN